MDERMRVLLPSIIGLMVGSWAILASAPPLTSSRASATELPEAHEHEAGRIEAIPARLWEDPLVVLGVYLHEHKGGVKAKEVFEECMSTSKDLLVLGVHLRGGHSGEDGEDRLRTRHAVVAALQAENYYARSPTHMGLLVLDPPRDQIPPKDPIRRVFDKLVDALDDTPEKEARAAFDGLLKKLVPERPDEDDKEAKKRRKILRKALEKFLHSIEEPSIEVEDKRAMRDALARLL
ncbi:MAG: hypothetical protein O7C98_16880, partial [Planctomycetota bacterium]|nr:hypothetical protein [Planctomycetota bacterium]